MKKKLLPLLGITLCFGLFACGETPSESSVGTSSIVPSSSAPVESEPIESETPIVKNKFTIYLAGDSTVKTYAENTFIGGWGQYLANMMDSDYVTVKNMAEGGRSSRSFINEGRLYTSSTQTAFSGESIEATIQAGDYLFIQFGHNDDDTKKASSYSTLYDRMVPLGTPDGNGIYPTTAGTKVSTSSLPNEYVTNASSSEQTAALSAIAKYGDTYYSYDCGGTYKWYLKQYVEFAQSKGAIPVLITPVARVKFSNGEIIGGAGLHGENFEYVEAVRQLASELDVALIDLFADTKEILETATADYANFLMALKPNDLQGTWPSTYDLTYQNTNYGYTGIEGTHYNKYGAYLTTAKLCEALLDNKELPLRHYVNTSGFYIQPSNNIPKAIISNLEALFSKVTVKNPVEVSQDINEVIAAINTLAAKTVTMENIVDLNAEIKAVKEKYFNVNVDDRSLVTNYEQIAAKELEIENYILANMKDPIAVYEFNANNLELIASTKEDILLSDSTAAEFKLISGGQEIKVQTATASVMIGLDTEPTEFSQRVSMGKGTATSRCISFTTTGACSVTIVCQSSSKTDVRAMSINNVATGAQQTVTAGLTATVSTVELTEAGEYWVGSTGSTVYTYMVRISYYE